MRSQTNSVHLRRQLRNSHFFQNYGTFNTNQNKKYHNFERIKIRATVTVRKIVLKLFLYLYFRTKVLKFTKVILKFRNLSEK